MINKLRSRAGKWHQLAKMLPVLAQAHYDSNAIDEVTGITPALQVSCAWSTLHLGPGVLDNPSRLHPAPLLV